MNRGQLLCLLGGVSLLFGALLPWATLQSLTLGLSRSLAGYEGEGVLTGGLGLLLLIGAIVSKGKPGKTYSIVAVILALIAGLDTFSVLRNLSEYFVKGFVALAGPGIYLSLAGAVIALVGGLQTVPAIPAAIQSPTQIQQSAPPSSGPHSG